MEKNTTNIGMTVESVEYDSEEENEVHLIDTDSVELNEFKKENYYLLVGIHGNGSGYLRAALYTELKTDNKSYKVKFLAKSAKDSNKPKKIVAELYQVEINERCHLILLSKSGISDQSFKYIVDFLDNNTTFKQVVVYDSLHLSKTILPEDFPDTLYSLKNTKQLQCNQMIAPKGLPAPNTIQDFAAYLITYYDFKDIPCVVYVLITSLYEVCLHSIKHFETPTYDFLRQKLTQNHIEENKINISLLLKEYNSFKNSVYT
jgi:hypothetical protein